MKPLPPDSRRTPTVAEQAERRRLTKAPSPRYDVGQRVTTAEGSATVVNPATVGAEWRQPDGGWLPGTLVRLDSG